MAAIGGAARVVSRDRRGVLCTYSTRFAWQASGMESCAAAETAGFRGPVREIGFARARGCVRRCETVAAAGNPWICGCKLVADVSQKAVAG